MRINYLDRKIFFLSLGVMIFLQFVISGCASLPTNEFKAYREAFNEARKVSQEVLNDYAVARDGLASIEEQKEKDKAKGRAPKDIPFPTVFDPKKAMGVDFEPDDIDVRILALETIARYNELLAALADGRSIDQVKSSVNAFTSSIESLEDFLPALGSVTPIAPLFKVLVAELEKARSREEFKKAVKGGDKIVARILDVLIKDTEDHYRLRFALANRNRLNIKARAGKHRLIIIQVVREHLSPSEPGFKPNTLQEIEDELNEKLRKMGWMENTILKPREPTGNPQKDNSWVYTKLADTQIKQSLNAIDEAITEYQRIVTELNDYYAMLISYVRLLEQTKQTLLNVRIAINSPNEFRHQAEELMRVVLRVRREIDNLRNN